MTLFGIDISNNNGPGIDMGQVKREGFDFVFAKVSEGDGFRDWTWPAYRDAALAAGLRVAGYHYLRADSDPDAQAALFLDQLGDADGHVATMVDFEADSGGQANFWAFVQAVNRRGREVNLSYEPRWYWDGLGEPDISALPGLIQSSYVNGSGFAAALYPGDDSGFWAGFGGATPQILQFTDRAQVAGHWMDANAFRGTLTELDQLLGFAPQPTPEVPPMPEPLTTDTPIAIQYNADGKLVVRDDNGNAINGPNAQLPLWALLSWVHGYSRRVEENTRAILAGQAALSAKLDQALSALPKAGA